MGNFKRFFLLLPAIILCLLAVIPAVFAAEETVSYNHTTELTTGQYILVTPDGWAPGVLADNGEEMPWVTIAQPEIRDGVVTNDNGAVWTLTVTEGGVTLCDPNGVYIAPAKDGMNGIVSGIYVWSAACEGSVFSFYGTSGETSVVLALNGTYGFRAYDESIVSGNPEGYPCRFSLYRAEAQELPTEPQETTQPEETTTPSETTEPEETDPPETTVPPEVTCAVTASVQSGEVDVTRDVPVTLTCETAGAAIYYCLSTDGEQFGEYILYESPILLSSGFGSLYVKAYAAAEDCLPGEETLCVYTEAPVPGWGLYFGQLHSHTDASDGCGTVQQAYAYAAQVEGLDFFAVTDHSDSFDNADSGQIAADASAISEKWAAGKAAAESVTSTKFVGIYGYEMSWPRGMNLGHISTFNTPGFQSWQQEGFNQYKSALQNYYAALTTVPNSISQFNHPGTFYGDFRDFSFYSEATDRVITLLEVGCGEELPTAYEYYDRALDAGWHVAPTNNQNNHEGQWGDADSGRTVVYAESLTEDGIYDALRNYRVYATEDCDLSISYSLNGQLMGSLLEKREVGDTVSIRVDISDPTDAVGTVEVIADGGTAIARETLEACSAAVEFTLPSIYRYYYIRITQPDGDIAVTAPVWVDGEENAGISVFSAGTAVPVQGQALELTLELYNNETAELTVESLTFSIDGETVYTAGEIAPLAQGETETCSFPLTWDGLGNTEITATVSAMLGDSPRIYQETLTLSFRKPDMVTTLLVDGTHGASADLTKLTALAVDNQISVTVESGAVTEEMLANCSILIVPAPETPFDGEFFTRVKEFVEYGGSVILCGRSDTGDGEVHTAEELNRLLSAIGATMRFCDDTAQDDINHGGNPAQLYFSSFNKESRWLGNVSPDQVYRHVDGCTVEPGSGTWLVKGHSTTYCADGDGDGQTGSGETVVLACEETGFGGRVFAAGSSFFSDADIAEPKNIWDAPYANRSILQVIFGDSEVQLPIHTISEVQTGEAGETYRIRGYVTAGTANPYNRFPDTLYLQDDTGGIAVVPFREEGISVGTPMDIVGYLDNRNGNPVLEVISWDVLDVPLYRYLPLEGDWEELLDITLHGGELVQVEGTVTEILPSGKTGISQLILEDDDGNTATVWIEETIFAGSTGKNKLAEEIKVKRTVRAMGILYLRPDGETVIRVRNCEEVVYVPPLNYVFNPDTGDGVNLWIAVLALSGTALLMDWKRRRGLM